MFRMGICTLLEDPQDMLRQLRPQELSPPKNLPKRDRMAIYERGEPKQLNLCARDSRTKVRSGDRSTMVHVVIRASTM